MKDLWIEAKNAFLEDFRHELKREPSEEEIEKLFPHYFEIYRGDMEDLAIPHPRLNNTSMEAPK